MPRTLIVPDGPARVVGTTTTTKLAERMLAAAGVVHAVLPHGFAATSPMTILLEIYLAEEAGRYLGVEQIGLTGHASLPVRQRWVAALEGADLIERQGRLIALSDHGYTTVVTVLENVFAVQRQLD